MPLLNVSEGILKNRLHFSIGGSIIEKTISHVPQTIHFKVDMSIELTTWALICNHSSNGIPLYHYHCSTNSMDFY